MVRRYLAVLIVAAATVAMPAAAQEVLGLSAGYDVSSMQQNERTEENARFKLAALRKTGSDAIQNKRYPDAERAFAELLRVDPKNPDVNFLMGVTQIALEKWSDAKGYLETAVMQDPQRPEPKTRLGLTYLRLADPDAAQKQRAELVRLDTACQHSCKDATWIADGLIQLDQAFAASAVGAAKTPPPTIALSVSSTLQPADYGQAQIKSVNDVLPVLTAAGRCPPGFKAPREEPCALIAYVPAQDVPGGFKQYYRPIFGVVNRNTIWTIVDSHMVSVSPKMLWAPVEVENTITRGVRNTYYPLAVMGSQENVDRCSQTRPCLPQKELFEHYRDHKALPEKFINDFWGKKLSDPGQKTYSSVR